MPKFTSIDDAKRQISAELMKNIKDGLSLDEISTTFTRAIKSYIHTRKSNPKLPFLKVEDILHISDENGNNSMHLASMSGNLDLVDWIWNQGADFENITNNIGLTAKDIYSGINGPRTQKLQDICATLAKALKQDILKSKTIDFVALKVQFGKHNIKYVLNAPTDPDGNTLLHHAFFRGDTALFEQLIEHGANRTILNKLGHSLQFLQAQNTSEDMKALIPLIKDPTKPKFDLTKLYEKYGSYFKLLLNAQDPETGNTLLHYAINFGRDDVAKEIMSYNTILSSCCDIGVDTTIKNKAGLSVKIYIETAREFTTAFIVNIEQAIKGIREYHECVAILPTLSKLIQDSTKPSLGLKALHDKYGPPFKKIINIPNPETGDTLLHYAIYAGRSDIANDLIWHGAKTSIKNKRQKSPDDYAKFVITELYNSKSIYDIPDAIRKHNAYKEIPGLLTLIQDPNKPPLGLRILYQKYGKNLQLMLKIQNPKTGKSLWDYLKDTKDESIIEQLKDIYLLPRTTQKHAAEPQKHTATKIFPMTEIDEYYMSAQDTQRKAPDSDSDVYNSSYPKLIGANGTDHSGGGYSIPSGSPYDSDDGW
jgi:ankyrin repeat protein